MSRLDIAHAALTDIGRKRSHNEDSLLADADLGLFIVCDGMGGRNAGEVASHMAVDVVHSHFREAALAGGVPLLGHFDPMFSVATNRLASAIRLANQAIHDAAAGDASRAGMGTTVVAAVVTGEILSIAHVGDSRLYLVRNGALQPLTADHSLVAEQVRHGILTEEEAERSPQRNIVTRALGIDPDTPIELDEAHIQRGDSLLLCSDGLTRGVKSEAILKTLLEEPTPASACRKLIDLANDAGGEDNTSVIVLAVQPASSTASWWRRLLGW
jgi:PPM family protein phosphatase